MANIFPSQYNFPSSDFKNDLYNIQRGVVPGYTYKQRHAYSSEVSATFFSCMWNIAPPTTYNFLLASQTLQISSTNANDTAAGTGARTVLIEGLDSNYDQISETISLNGTAGVTTANSYFRINSLTTQTYGTDKRNRGDIYLGSGVIIAGVNSIPHSLIVAGANISEIGVLTVPRGYTFILYDYNVAVSAGKEATLRARVRTSPSSPFTYGGGTSVFEKRTDTFETTLSIIPEQNDIEVLAIANSANTKVVLDLQTALVDNKFL